MCVILVWFVGFASETTITEKRSLAHVEGCLMRQLWPGPLLSFERSTLKRQVKS